MATGTISGGSQIGPLAQAITILEMDPAERQKRVAEYEAARAAAQTAQLAAEQAKRDADLRIKAAEAAEAKAAQSADALAGQSQQKMSDAETAMAQVAEARATLDADRKAFTLSSAAEADRLDKLRLVMDSRERALANTADEYLKTADALTRREEAVAQQEKENAEIRADLDKRIAAIRAAVG